MRKIKERTFSGTTDPKVTERELENREVARRAAAGGMVLLKNEDNVLPVAPGTKIALYGSGAIKTVKGGTGSGDVNERECVSIYEGMKNAGYVITTEDWISDYAAQYEKARTDWRDEILEKSMGKQDSTFEFFGVYTSTPFVRPSGKAAEKTDAGYAFYILSRVAGEGADRFDAAGDYLLTDEEERMLSDICNYYEKVVVIVNTGGLVDLSFMDKYENIKGLIQMVQPGMEGGNAFADLISGKVSPSGKMTDTWAYKYSDYPNAENFSHNNGNVDSEKYNEGIYVGYRYFDTFHIPVRYGFGYGLSYTDFDIRVKNISCSADAKEPSVIICVEVENTGSRYSGKEVVQAYVSCPAGKLEKEYRRLAAFEKTEELAPGESQELALVIPVYQLASYDETEPGWVLEAGKYGIWIGNSLESSELVGEAEADETAVLVHTDNICPLKEELEEYHADAGENRTRYEAAADAVGADNLIQIKLSVSGLKTEEIEYRANKEIYTEEARQFVDQLTTDELVCLSAGDPGKAQGGNLGAAGISVPGSAGETHSCALDKGLASIVLADGPAGLRLMRYYHVDDGKIVNMPFQFSLEGGDLLPGYR